MKMIQMIDIVYHIANGVVIPRGDCTKIKEESILRCKKIRNRQILRQLCEWKGVNILEAEVCIDHVHMLIEIPPMYSVSGVMEFLKGKSSQMIYERWSNAWCKYRNRLFWCRGYYVDTVGKTRKQ